jgi:hypothetical protein
MSLIAPLSIKLYGVDNEVKREVTRSIIPWGVLERALDIQEQFEDVELGADGMPQKINREQIQQLTDFVVFIFDDAVTRDELKRQASLADMFALYQQIFMMVGQIMPKNPTPALSPTQNLQKVRQGRKP